MFFFQTQRALHRAASVPIRLCPTCRRHKSTAPGVDKRVIFSGIQPTGVPHLGNYLGALRQWKKLQDGAQPGDELFFSIVDLHAITVKQDNEQLRRWRREMFVSLLAVGLDPNKSTIFAQGDVPAHAELMWILSCNASMGYLGRMTQWKSKLSLPDNASPLDPSPTNQPALKLGLFSYPVLQAADILLYGTTHVPVGEDQAQHLEFARELAIGFNHVFAPQKQKPILTPPQTILSPAKRVMSLTNPTKKMSKSDSNPMSRILITDSKDQIRKKINAARTDSIEGISYDRELRPGVSNLIDILYYMDESSASSPEHLADELSAANTSMRALKERVADAIERDIGAVRERYQQAIDMGDAEMKSMAWNGAMQARSSAGRTIGLVREAVGLNWGW